MFRRRLSVVFAVGICATLVALAGAMAQPVEIPEDDGPPIKGKPKDKIKPKVQPPLAGQNVVTQFFPCDASGKCERPVTGWKVEWATLRGNGLYIKGAWFKRSASEEWMQVLGDARLAQAFVPYHRGSPRFWDVSYGFDMDVLNKTDAGPTGQLLIAPGGKTPTVVKEIRDRGIMFRHPRVGSRRGQTMVLWGSLAAANYRYMIEYGFQDEGTITFRVGASGHNYPGSEWVPHMHNAMFRIDVNLDDKDHNSVELCEHIEPDGEPAKARSEHRVLKQACGVDWDAAKFTMLRVISTTKKNARGEPISYDLVPSRMGNARHFGKGKDKGVLMEECTQHDFWVTRADPKQMTFHMLPEYVKSKQMVEDTDVVLWYTASCHHEPRSEDGEMKNGSFQGATHVMWCGFDLRPRNVFDRSPFFPYPGE
jgi:primary-amine oxidase